MKFDELVQKLLEGVSPLRTMYHITYIPIMYEIITYNAFVCQTTNAVDLEDYWDSSSIPEIMRKYPYYMSTARTHGSMYIRDKARSTRRSLVTMELDASKLSDKGYPIYPINFFKKSSEQEAEDRVLSKKNIIPNFLNYVKAFHIMLASKQSNKEEDEMIELMKGTGKPCYLYDDIKAFLVLNRTKRKQL